MEQSYKFRIYPTDIQKTLIAKSFGCARWVYNYFLNESTASISAGIRVQLITTGTLSLRS